MSDEKFTPGPWYLCDVGDYNDFGGNSRVILSEPWGGDNPHRLAVVHTRVDNEESEANATLMAASPELYEALRDLCERGGPDDGGCVIAKGISALKKARGET
jgi:hypothetical protein